MACDEIVAEELTVTGSIGVVSSKFNAAELNEKAGVGVDTISRGRYAEVMCHRQTRQIASMQLLRFFRLLVACTMGCLSP